MASASSCSGSSVRSHVYLKARRFRAAFRALVSCLLLWTSCTGLSRRQAPLSMRSTCCACSPARAQHNGAPAFNQGHCIRPHMPGKAKTGASFAIGIVRKWCKQTHHWLLVVTMHFILPATLGKAKRSGLRDIIFCVKLTSVSHLRWGVQRRSVLQGKTSRPICISEQRVRSTMAGLS
jgi:hypothetical protein